MGCFIAAVFFGYFLHKQKVTKKKNFHIKEFVYQSTPIMLMCHSPSSTKPKLKTLLNHKVTKAPRSTKRKTKNPTHSTSYQLVNAITASQYFTTVVQQLNRNTRRKRDVIFFDIGFCFFFDFQKRKIEARRLIPPKKIMQFVSYSPMQKIIYLPQILNSQFYLNVFLIWLATSTV